MQIARFLTQILEGEFFRTIFQHKRAVALAVHTVVEMLGKLYDDCIAAAAAVLH